MLLELSHSSLRVLIQLFCETQLSPSPPAAGPCARKALILAKAINHKELTD